MINTIKKAVDRLGFRISNHWKHDKTDIEAYNKIVEFVEQKNQQQFNDNQLFGKLFIIYYGELLKFYRGSVFSEMPKKELFKQLDKPIERIIDDFVKISNDQETFLRMKQAGISEKHPATKTDKEKELEKDKFKMNMLDPVMTYKEACVNLTAMINNALNSFN